MSFLKRVFSFYINSSIHVALAVLAFAGLTYERFDLSPDLGLLMFIFTGTITGYNFVKYAGIAQLHHRSLTEGLKIIQIFSFVCFLALVYFIFHVGWPVLKACIPLAILTLFYAIPLWPNKDNLRTTPSLKIFVIAAVWTGVSVYLPLLEHHEISGFGLLLVLVERFFIVLALIIPFELRDLHYDSKKLATLPQLIGVNKTKYLGYFLLIFAGVLCTIIGIDYTVKSGATVVVILLTGLTIYRAGIVQSRYYASFWVEGIPIYCWLGSQLI